MPDASSMPMIPPGVDPQQYYQAMRQQMLAQALTNRAITPPTVENYGPMRSRLSPLSGVGNIVAALMARKAMDQSMGTQAQMYGKALSSFGGPTPAAAPDASTAPSDGAAPAAAGSAPMATGPAAGVPMVQPGGPSGGGPLPASAVAPSAPQGTTQLNPLGLPPQLALQMYMRDPAKYGELLAGTPEWRTALAASGGNPQQAMAMLQAESLKKGTIEGRPGQFLSGPQGAMIAPDVARGEQYVPDGQGGWKAIPIGGGSEIQAQRAAALKSAQEAVTPHYEPDPFHPGQSHVVYPPPPPGQTGATPGSPSGTTPDYFKPPSPPLHIPHTAADLEQEKKGVESGQAYSDQLVKNAENATEVRRSLAELRNLATVGGVSVSNPAKLQAGSMMIAMGADPDTVGRLLKTDVGALTAASKQTGSLALDSIHSMTSRGTNFDLATFMRYNPNLDMASPEGFRRVTEFMDKRMQQEVAKQADFDQWSQNQPPNRWSSGHAAHWLAQQNKQISSGASNSRPPLSQFRVPGQ